LVGPSFNLSISAAASAIIASSFFLFAVLDNLFPIISILKVNGAARGSFFSLCKSERFSPHFCACNEREFKKRITLMGKTGTEKPLKAPKKKSKELDDDDLAALARKKEEQAKLNALKKQVAGGGKLGKGLQKSK